MNIKTLAGIIFTFLLIGGLLYSSKFLKNNEVKELEHSGDLVSEEGIHWHPELMIYMKGQKQPILANIGIGMQYAGYPRFDSMMRMTDIHTHDDSGILHWEVMRGPVTKEDVRLGNFFAIWGKKFDENCIFEFCGGPEGVVKMFVNGAPSAEFQHYLVKDGDKIEVRYE